MVGCVAPEDAVFDLDVAISCTGDAADAVVAVVGITHDRAAVGDEVGSFDEGGSAVGPGRVAVDEGVGELEGGATRDMEAAAEGDAGIRVIADDAIFDFEGGACRSVDGEAAAVAVVAGVIGPTAAGEGEPDERAAFDSLATAEDGAGFAGRADDGLSGACGAADFDGFFNHEALGVVARQDFDEVAFVGYGVGFCDGGVGFADRSIAGGVVAGGGDPEGGADGFLHLHRHDPVGESSAGGGPHAECVVARGGRCAGELASSGVEGHAGRQCAYD